MREARNPTKIRFVAGAGAVVVGCTDCKGTGTLGNGAATWRCDNCSGRGVRKAECAYCVDSCERGDAYELIYDGGASEFCCDEQCARWRIIGPVSNEKIEVEKQIHAARKKVQPAWKPKQTAPTIR